MILERTPRRSNEPVSAEPRSFQLSAPRRRWRQAVSLRWRQAVSLCWWRQAVSLSDVVIELILFEAANALGDVLGVKIHGTVHLQDCAATIPSSLDGAGEELHR